MVEEEMQLDVSFLPPKMSPIKLGQAQINGRGIQRQKLIFEAELLLSWDLASDLGQQREEDFLVELPGAVGVGIRQGRVARGVDYQMFQISLTASQAAGYFPQGMGSAELAKEHGYKLTPTGEPFGPPFRSSSADGLNEFRLGKDL